MLRGFAHSFETDPSALLGAFPPLPLPAALRHSALVALQAAVKARTPACRLRVQGVGAFPPLPKRRRGTLRWWRCRPP